MISGDDPTLDVTTLMEPVSPNVLHDSGQMIILFIHVSRLIRSLNITASPLISDLTFTPLLNHNLAEQNVYIHWNRATILYEILVNKLIGF